MANGASRRRTDKRRADRIRKCFRRADGQVVVLFARPRVRGPLPDRLRAWHEKLAKFRNEHPGASLGEAMVACRSCGSAAEINLKDEP